MATYTWIVHDEDGRDLQTSEGFASKDEAEAWLGREWSALAAAGGDSVSLMEDEVLEYRMSLKPE